MTLDKMPNAAETKQIVEETAEEKRSYHELTSPDVDDLIQVCTGSGGAGGTRLWSGFSFHEHTNQSKSEYLFCLVERVHDLLSRIRPEIEGKDTIWSLWLRTERGAIENFGDFDALIEDGDIASYEEFESLWQVEYPEPVQWRRLTVVHYDAHLFFSLQKDFSFNVNLTSAVFKGVDVADKEGHELVSWLLDAVENESRCIIRDPERYNRTIEETLPLSKRFGCIQRMDIWDRSDDANRLDVEMGVENLAAFGRTANCLGDKAIIESMTLADFLGYCEICYDANNYTSYSSDASPMEKYRVMADNRDEGLLDLPPDDPDAFAAWYRNRAGGGHPFEICRGGNSTHISLHVTEYETGWQLYLSGFSVARVVETAKMGIALFACGVPFVLADKDEMRRMLNGEDFVGIVPDDIGLGYNHQEFPKEDRIYSFAHLWMVRELEDRLINRITWYPIPKSLLNNQA